MTILEMAKAQGRLEAELEWLAKVEPGTLARAFFRLGIRGRRGNICECPLAVYLKRRGYSSPRVTDDAVYTYHAVAAGTAKLESHLPENLTDFVIAFDAHEYPLLTANTWELKS